MKNEIPPIAWHVKKETVVVYTVLHTCKHPTGIFVSFLFPIQTAIDVHDSDCPQFAPVGAGFGAWHEGTETSNSEREQPRIILSEEYYSAAAARL